MKHILPGLIRFNRKVFVSLVLISSLGICTLTSLLNTYKGLDAALNNYFHEYQYPDVTVISQEPFEKDMVGQVEQIDGVLEVQYRLCVDTDASYGDEIVSLRCYSADEGDMVRYCVNAALPEVPQGYLPMALEACFVDLAGFELGDTFTLYFDGEPVLCVLTSVVTSPECVIVYRDKNFDASTDEFGYAFFPYDDLKEMAGISADIYNQVLVMTKEGAADSVEQEILDSGMFGSVVHSYTWW